MYSEEITAVVIDIGNTSCRAGSSGEDTPKYIIPSSVGVVENEGADQTMEIEGAESKKPGKSYYTGDHQLKYRRDNMEVVEACRNDTDFDIVEKLVNDIYYQNLQILPTQYPLLMSESSLHNKTQRQKIAEMAFEKFNLPAFYVCKSAVLSCFASGRSTSLVLDSGASHTMAVPISDGYALQKSLIKADIGGEYLTERVLRIIEDSLKVPVVPRSNLNIKVDEDGNKHISYEDFPNTMTSFTNYSKMDIARDIKETVCKLIDIKQEGVKNEKMEYELPDGKVIDLGEARYTVGETLFNTNTVKQDTKDLDFSNFKGLHHMVMESINKCDIDLRKELLSNIILTGGNSLFGGLYEILQKKLTDIAPQNAKLKLIAYPLPIERRYSTWIGGSILSSLGSFQNMWISKSEYDEVGSYIIEKKCP